MWWWWTNSKYSVFFDSIFRNSDSSVGMRGNSNGVRKLTSPDRGEREKRGGGATGNNHSSHHHNNKSNNNNNTSHHNDNHHQHGGGGGGSGSSETGKKSGSSSGDTIAAMWPPKFVIALTNKEKEEDFMAIKGSKLPQRPKKRAKLIQRTLNVSLLCLFFGDSWFYWNKWFPFLVLGRNYRIVFVYYYMVSKIWYRRIDRGISILFLWKIDRRSFWCY